MLKLFFFAFTLGAMGVIASVTQLNLATQSKNGPITSGLYANAPKPCQLGTLYVATDQPLGQQLYVCSNTSSGVAWVQEVSIGGGSNGLQFNNGSLDVNPAVIPLLGNPITFGGLVTVTNGMVMSTTAVQPPCDSSHHAWQWFQNGNGITPDGPTQVCKFDGTNYAWTQP